LPKDLDELNRLDFQHSIYRLVQRGNFLVPLDEPRTILDLASGTGRWCQEMALQFPSATVYGFDLENPRASQPLPANDRFVQGNLLNGLPFGDNTFDFVHQRLTLASAVPLLQWEPLLREMVRVICPGGWLELAEVGVEVVNMGPLTQEFLAWGIEAGKSRGLDVREIPRLEAYVKRAGAINTGLRWYDVPLGEWGNRVGKLMQQNMVLALGALKALYLERGASEEDFTSLLNQLPAEWQKHRSCMRFFIFWGQKEG
jgi:ubiquinone/menaquinone biosynthesis C-methylase UbiE